MSEVAEGSKVSILSKNEKKSRELIQKLGLKPILGINRVTFRKKDNQIFAIDKPDVYKSHGGNYVVFGEPKVDDFTCRLAKAQQHAAASTKSPSAIQADMAAAASEQAPASGTVQEEDSVQADESGLDGADIELIMQQTNVSRNKAVKALREHDQDIVNAIMSLSK